MNIPLYFLLPALGCCLLIAFQDIKDREIHLLPLLLLTLLGTSFGLLSESSLWLKSFGMNLALIVLITGIPALYFSLKGRRFFDEMLGWGDIVFMLAAASWLTPPHFILFYSISTLGALAGVGVLAALGEFQKDTSVPLAAAMSIVLIVCLFLPI